MEYLEKMLGVSVKYHRWKGELELPYYITERYEMRLVELDKMKCIFLWPKDKLSQIGEAASSYPNGRSTACSFHYGYDRRIQKDCIHKSTYFIYSAGQSDLSSVYGYLS